MIRHNQTIFDFLTTYVTMPDPHYAILLKGKWGCGKTYFIEEWLKAYNQPKEDVGEVDIVLKPIRVSLYGMSEVRQITDAIDKELHPFMHSKFVKYAKKGLNIFGKVTISSKFDIFGNDDEEETSFSTSIDALSLFKSDDKSIKGARFLVFDDLERCSIDTRELLGYINYFVERCRCHVVIIGDVTHADKDVQVQLAEFKEKTIGREFTIVPEMDSALNFFLKEIFEVDWLTLQKPLIKRTFEATRCENLRILRQCIYDFKVQYQDWDGRLIANDKTFLKNLLVSYIVVYCEYKGGNSEVLRKWHTNYIQGLMIINDDAKTAIGQLQTKYNAFSEKEGLEALNADNIANIVYSIETGCSTAQYVNTSMSNLQAQPSILDRLVTFMDMTNKEVVKTSEKLAKEIADGKVANVYVVGRAISLMAYLDSIDICPLRRKTMNSAITFIKECMKKTKTMDDLYSVRNAAVQGFNSYQSELKLPKRKEVGDDVQAFFELKTDTMKNRMDEALDNLSDRNVGELMDIDSATMPDGHCAYELSPLFAKTDIKKLCKSIEGLSNKGKKVFCKFLQGHFKLWCQVDGIREYIDDTDRLKEILEKLKVMESKSVKVDKYAFNKLIVCIDNCIKRCEGDRNVLM